MDDVVFVHLQPAEELDIGSYKITSELPLPVLKEELERIVKLKEIPWPAFVRGIIHVFAYDPKFVYAEEYRRLIYSHEPKIEEILLREGAQLAKNKHLALAYVIFKGLSNLNPDFPAALFNLALCYRDLSIHFQDKDLKKSASFLTEAIEALEKIVAQGKDTALIHYNLGYLYRQIGNFSMAKEAWEKAIAMGIEEQFAEELAALINDLDRLDIVEAQFGAGTNALENGRYKEAVTLLKPLAKRYPHWWQASFNLGLAYRGLDDLTKAIEALGEAAMMNGAWPEVHSQIGLCHFAQGDFEKAEKALWRAVSLKPEDNGLLTNLGLVFLKQERFNQAADVLYQAQAIAPADPITQHYIKQLPSAFQR